MEQREVKIGAYVTFTVYDSGKAMLGCDNCCSVILSKAELEAITSELASVLKANPDEYEVVEIDEFDNLRVGDLLQNGDTVEQIEGSKAIMDSGKVLHDNCIFQWFPHLQVRRKVEPVKCVVECELYDKGSLGAHLSVCFGKSSGFNPGDLVVMTVEKKG